MADSNIELEVVSVSVWGAVLECLHVVRGNKDQDQVNVELKEVGYIHNRWCQDKESQSVGQGVGTGVQGRVGCSSLIQTSSFGITCLILE